MKYRYCHRYFRRFRHWYSVEGRFDRYLLVCVRMCVCLRWCQTKFNPFHEIPENAFRKYFSNLCVRSRQLSYVRFRLIDWFKFSVVFFLRTSCVFVCVSRCVCERVFAWISTNRHYISSSPFFLSLKHTIAFVAKIDYLVRVPHINSVFILHAVMISLRKCINDYNVVGEASSKFKFRLVAEPFLIISLFHFCVNRCDGVRVLLRFLL